MRALGIDLAGSEKRNTGICLMDEKLNAETRVLNTDKEILDFVKSGELDIISIDAPLSIPKGRCCLELHCKDKPHLRECDRELLKMKIRFFPLTLGPMRKLTNRGLKLKGIFEKAGIEVIESYPGAFQDILGIPRKQEGLDKLRTGLIKYGVKGIRKGAIHDELDAVCSAIVGKMYLENKHKAIGDPKEGLMILPSRQ